MGNVQSTIKTLRPFLIFLYCFGIIILLLNCAGCLTTPPGLKTNRRIPADKYDYLAAAVNFDLVSRVETNDTQKIEMLNMSRKLYDVWKNSQKYKFPRFPAKWSSSQVMFVRNITHHETLVYLELILKQYESVPFEQDVNAAIKKLKYEKGVGVAGS